MVVVKGTTNGAITDVGTFSLRNLKEGDVIVLVLGYKTQAIPYTGQEKLQQFLKLSLN